MLKRCFPLIIRNNHIIRVTIGFYFLTCLMGKSNSLSFFGGEFFVARVSGRRRHPKSEVFQDLP